MMTRTKRFFVVGALIGAGLSVGCGDDAEDDSNVFVDGSTDMDSDVNADGSTKDGSAGGCTFAGYVIGLISGSTTATAKPDPSLGSACTESTSQADFKPLFP